MDTRARNPEPETPGPENPEPQNPGPGTNPYGAAPAGPDASGTGSDSVATDPPDWDAVAAIEHAQDGVISRRQARECRCRPADIRRRLRRKEWTPICPGVYVNHTGPPTWRQRAWAAVLDVHPAALGGVTALKMGRGTIHVVVDAGRTVHDRKKHKRAGVVIHRRTRLKESVHWDHSPPRLRVEEAALDVADGAGSDREAIATLSDIVNRRKTTADRLLAAMTKRPRMKRRAFLTAVLGDIKNGTRSVLEQHYLSAVERAHGLPCPQRQVRTAMGRNGLRDATYPEFRLVVELDGDSFHGDAASRDRDRERDLDAALASGLLTVRLGCGQVFDSPCTTAGKMAQLLMRRGWIGCVRACPSCPPDGPPVPAYAPPVR